MALPRAIVCALAAELIFPMQTQPSAFFADTDLLDFPGARNRFDQPLSKTLANPAATVSGLLLRGKVAYLFDRYVEDQEITSMLLCVPDSNMETLDLPGLVENWIVQTHGGTPEERATNDCTLFFVLTKFDKHLADSAAGGEESLRFERRMKFSMAEKFGRGRDPWVDVWTPSAPFQNCFWLRNPNFFVEGLIDYEGDRELRVRPEKAARLDELREGCVSAPLVRRHFGDPEAAWDAAMTMNDGGVGYLTAALTRTSKPESKVRQLRTQIDKVAREISAALSPYYVSDDIEQRIEQKRAAAADLIDGLETSLQNHRFAAFQRMLMVDQEVIQDRIARVPSSIRISNAVSAAADMASMRDGGPPMTVAPARPGRPKRVTPEPAADEAGSIRTMSIEAFQAEGAIEVWMDRLNALRSDVATLRSFGLTQAAASDLVSELSHALRRTGVPEQMRRQLGTLSFGLTVDKQAPAAAIVCAERINTYVNGLGYLSVPEQDRPKADHADGPRPVFAATHAHDSIDTLPAWPRPVAEEKWTDWMFALEAMFIANAMDSGGGSVNVVQNGRIGRVLSALGAA